MVCPVKDGWSAAPSRKVGRPLLSYRPCIRRANGLQDGCVSGPCLAAATLEILECDWGAKLVTVKAHGPSVAHSPRSSTLGNRERVTLGSHSFSGNRNPNWNSALEAKPASRPPRSGCDRCVDGYTQTHTASQLSAVGQVEQLELACSLHFGVRFKAVDQVASCAFIGVSCCFTHPLLLRPTLSS